MSQRLEPGEIFHNEIFVLVKYPKSFPPCKTIPRGNQGSKPVWVCARACGRSPAWSQGLGVKEGGREAVPHWVRQARGQWLTLILEVQWLLQSVLRSPELLDPFPVSKLGSFPGEFTPDPHQD